MALPVAQLGYMPNLGAPGRGPTTVIDDPWQQLAVQALSAALTKGISNSFEQDYTQQAQNEGLPIDPTAKAAAWYKKPFTGARTDEEQLNRLRGEAAATSRTVLSDKAATKRHDESIKATREEGAATRANQVDMRKIDQLFASTEGQANRTNQVAMNEADNTAAIERLNLQIVAEERALGRKLTSAEQQVVVQSFIDQAGKMTAAAPAENMKQQLLNPGSPPIDPNTQIDALAQKLQSMGYQIVPMQR